MSTHAGWFPDPNGAPTQRWWDGQSWTEHLQPLAPPYPPPQLQYASAPPAVVQDDGSNGLVVAGYIFAALMPIIGFILGIVAVTRPVQRISKQGIWIIVVSVVAFFVWVAILSSGGSSGGYTY